MATHAATRNISGLARAMVQQGLLSENDAEALQNQAQAASVGFVEQMLLSKRMNASQVAEFASRAFGTPLMDLSGFDIDHINKEYVDPKIAVSRRVLPLHKRGNRLFVAVSDPANLKALDEVRFKTNLVVDPVGVEVEEPRYRFPRQHTADAVRGKDRVADTRLGRRQARHRSARLRTVSAAAFVKRDPTAVRHDPGHGSDRHR